jgi:hypothetical protein
VYLRRESGLKVLQFVKLFSRDDGARRTDSKPGSTSRSNRLRNHFFGARHGRSTQPLSATTASRSPRESLSRSPRITFPAKSSSGGPFSSSRCYQSLYLKTVFRWAIVQPRVRGASIPYLKIEKKQKTEKSASKNAHFRGNRSKTTQNLRNTPPEIGTFEGPFQF